MEKKDPFAATIPAPTAARPLLGLTILVIEDSRYACAAVHVSAVLTASVPRAGICRFTARLLLSLIWACLTAMGQS